MRIVLRDTVSIYANPVPNLVSRQAVFPGLVKLDSGELLAMFSIGEAFDSADMRSYVSRSSDDGRTWQAPELMHTGEVSGDVESESYKPLKLSDGSLIAAGYTFVRPDKLTPIVDPDTSLVLPMRNRVSFSGDEGRTWTVPQVFNVEDQGLELSGPAIELASGRIIAAAPPFHLGSSGHEGWIIFSDDRGKSWDKLSTFYRSEGGEIGAWECRLCETEPGKVVVLFWAYDNANGRNLDNHIVISTDGGESSGPAISTGIHAQASSLLPLGSDRLLTIHAHRESPVGLIVRELRIARGSVEVASECALFAQETMAASTDGIADQFASLKFGQPSLLRLSETEVLATCWQVENCQYVIKGYRLGIEPDS